MWILCKVFNILFNKYCLLDMNLNFVVFYVFFENLYIDTIFHINFITTRHTYKQIMYKLYIYMVS